MMRIFSVLFFDKNSKLRDIFHVISSDNIRIKTKEGLNFMNYCLLNYFTV